ncbi:hypothetical protein D3C79_884660 [compost metagenome]
MHRRQEAVDAVLFVGKAELGHAAHDLFFQLVGSLYFGLDEQVAVFLQHRRQFIAAQAATVEHRHWVTALVGQVLNQNEGEQGQALGSLVDLGGGLVRDEVVETTGIADQLKAQGLEQAAVLVLEIRQLGVQLRITAADMKTLEQLAEDRCELGQFGKIKMHGQGSQ